MQLINFYIKTTKIEMCLFCYRILGAAYSRQYPSLTKSF